MFKTSDVRRSYLDFFVSKGHTEVPSSPIVPDNDPTLMFTSAGMVQFKDVFTGKKQLPFKRATTAQKCLRAGGKHNDLDNVGYTARHHTFFEMLGNFSFGDYFKEEAISWAWQYVNEILGLPKDRLLVTVHSSDEEAAKLWSKIASFSEDKIIRISTSDNFWTMGDTGPCGPCSEIFYDHGDKVQGGPPGSADEDGDRFIEIWNLVFTQFNTLPDGSRKPLETPCIDTGMGLERIAAVLQGVHSNYDIDLFKEIIADVKKETHCDDPKYTHHFQVIADHMRAICFMIAEGITPSNEGRGYVLRRIIRRALRHGYSMGMQEPFLFKLVPSVKKSMGGHYKELIRSESPTVEVLKGEEIGFMKTIDKGMAILEGELKKIGSSQRFPADVAYKLYDTYGFPLDLTQDALKAYGKTVNEQEFNEFSKEQREKSKKAWIGSGSAATSKVWYQVKDQVKTTEFVRATYELEANILAIIKEDQMVEEAGVSDELIYIIADKTPFYAESGGQVGDSGLIRQGSFNEAQVVDCQIIAGVRAHKCVVTKGTIIVHKPARFEINRKKRLGSSRNHTATHILQKVLKEVLGERVSQKGSLVSSSRLRFDFIHNGSISSEELALIERMCNDIIDKGLPVTTEIKSLDEAIASGAMALFGEKYPEQVRVVNIGKDGWSRELCGGEHVSNTWQIKEMKIIGACSIGSGIKRIEAFTGDCVRAFLEEEIQKLESDLQHQKTLVKNLERRNTELNANKEVSFKEEKFENGIIFKTTTLQSFDNKAILALIDKQKEDTSPKAVFVSNIKNNRGSVCLFSNLSVPAIDLLKQAIEQINPEIRVGGRKDLAQAGGIDLKDLERLKSIVAKIIKEN